MKKQGLMASLEQGTLNGFFSFPMVEVGTDLNFK